LDSDGLDLDGFDESFFGEGFFEDVFLDEGWFLGEGLRVILAMIRVY
jgi:hypothetical protein